jgi:hypothetical protein
MGVRVVGGKAIIIVDKQRVSCQLGINTDLNSAIHNAYFITETRPCESAKSNRI